jgi:hypothetical protein
VSSHDHELEAVPGLPSALPEGERLLWQGRPQWKSLARRTFKADWVAAWLGFFVAMRLVVGLQRGEGAAAFTAAGVGLLLAIVCLGIVALLALGYARATVYSITSQRVVMRIGVAFPLNINLPFKRLASADLVDQGNGVGDIVLRLAGPDRIALLYLWPHNQGLHFARPQPSLLCIPRAQEAAETLRQAVERWSATVGAPVVLGASMAASRTDSALAQLAVASEN